MNWMLSQGRDWRIKGTVELLQLERDRLVASARGVRLSDPTVTDIERSVSISVFGMMLETNRRSHNIVCRPNSKRLKSNHIVSASRDVKSVSNGSGNPICGISGPREATDQNPHGVLIITGTRSFEQAAILPLPTVIRGF